jgi:hypothetical protein
VRFWDLPNDINDGDKIDKNEKSGSQAGIDNLHSSQGNVKDIGSEEEGSPNGQLK